MPRVRGEETHANIGIIAWLDNHYKQVRGKGWFVDKPNNIETLFNRPVNDTKIGAALNVFARRFPLGDCHNPFG